MTESAVSWVADRIRECLPPDSSHTNPVQALFTVVETLAGKGSSLFGMTFSGPPPGADALAAQAKEGLHAWYRHFVAKGDEKSQVALWRGVSRIGVTLDGPEPTILVRYRQVLAERGAKLASLPPLLDTLSIVSPRVFGQLKALSPEAREPARYGHAGFRWLEGSWESLLYPMGPVPPCFLPIAGGDGDVLGVYVARAFSSGEPEAPILEIPHDDAMAWWAEGLPQLDAIARTGVPSAKEWKRDPRRGQKHPAVLELLDQLHASAKTDSSQEELALTRRFLDPDESPEEVTDALIALHERDGNVFAATSLKAQRIIRRYSPLIPKV